MNYDLEHGPHGQAYKLLVGLVAPRPIALITSMDEDGLLNAAPFSAYNYLCTDPPIVGVGVTNRSGQQFVPKDTARNIRRTGTPHSSAASTRQWRSAAPGLSWDAWSPFMLRTGSWIRPGLISRPTSCILSAA